MLTALFCLCHSCFAVSENGFAVDMSVDHKPEDAVETARINKAGGKVTSDGRVNNGLNLSRALGMEIGEWRIVIADCMYSDCLSCFVSCTGDHNYKRNEALDLSGESDFD